MQYATSASVKIRCVKRSPYRSIVAAMRGMSVASSPTPMMFTLPKPSGAFRWVQLPPFDERSGQAGAGVRCADAVRVPLLHDARVEAGSARGHGGWMDRGRGSGRRRAGAPRSTATGSRRRRRRAAKRRRTHDTGRGRARRGRHPPHERCRAGDLDSGRRLPADPRRRPSDSGGRRRPCGLARSGVARASRHNRAARGGVRQPPRRFARRYRTFDRRVLLRGRRGCSCAVRGLRGCGASSDGLPSTPPCRPAIRRLRRCRRHAAPATGSSTAGNAPATS